MSTFSSNVTIKANAAVAVSRTTNGTLYTAPSNGFARLVLSVSKGGATQSEITFLIDGKVVAQALTDSSSGNGAYFTGQQNPGNTGTHATLAVVVEVPPGKTLSVTMTALAGSAGTATATGTEYVNTP